MAFMSFLKKKKEIPRFEFPTAEELDVPPAPPSSAELPEFPSFDEEEPMQMEMQRPEPKPMMFKPEPKQSFEERMPIMQKPELKQAQQKEETGYAPRFPELPSEDAEDEPTYQRRMPDSSNKEKGPYAERTHIHPDKPIFVHIDFFKGIYDDITVMRNTLKQNYEILGRMMDYKTDEDVEYEKWYKQVEDLQRKLMFVDKTLFG